MSDAFRVNVRALAEFCLEGGDLVREGNAMERMREGMRGHQLHQSDYAEGWESEVSLSMEFESDGITLRLYGRADGLNRACVPPVIEEIKTTERDVAFIQPDDVPVHWMQAELYAAMLSETEDFGAVSVRLTYINLAGGTVSFTRTFARESLLKTLADCAAPYARWLTSLEGWKSVSRPSMRALAFPFDGYRAGQREMAANVYVALRDSRRLLCQAPTGIGKTAAALYPALKALGEEKIGRIFFLTARTTGQRAAEDALARMRRKGLVCRSVTLTAREKACPYPDVVCSPETCPLARGYYDRRRAALYEALTMEELTPGSIAALAAKHNLCPFEFSLDLSEIADAVICDYNYVFDPRVKLQRFFTGKSDAGILVDEAHNLCARARSMLSAQLSQRGFRDLRVHIGREAGRKHPLYKALTSFLNVLKEARASFDAERTQTDAPAELIAAAREAFSVIGQHLNAPHSFRAELADRFFELMDFLRCAEGYTEDYRTLLTADGKTMLTVSLICVNPAPYLDRAMKRLHGTALFSATLSPMPFYRDITGLSDEAGDALLDLPSPFPPENLLVLRAPLPVRYRQREETLPALASLIRAFACAKQGNYLAFFPSYAYLQKTLEALEPILPPDVRLLVQKREMDDAARAEFLAEFQPDPDGTLLGLAVLGGVFSEGVDLPGGRLTGAVIVGTGVPQVCSENDLLRDVYEERFSGGYRYAYLYPGVARVLQAAGRVIRSETDRGAVLLVDSRWTDAEHIYLLPPHWKCETIRDEQALLARLGVFYSGFSGK